MEPRKKPNTSSTTTRRIPNITTNHSWHLLRLRRKPILIHTHLNNHKHILRSITTNRNRTKQSLPSKKKLKITKILTTISSTNSHTIHTHTNTTIQIQRTSIHRPNSITRIPRKHSNHHIRHKHTSHLPRLHGRSLRIHKLHRTTTSIRMVRTNTTKPTLDNTSPNRNNRTHNGIPHTTKLYNTNKTKNKNP